MKFKTLLFVVGLMFLNWSCSSIQVYSDYTPNTDYSVYSTYNFLDWNIENNAKINEFDKERLYNAIEYEMGIRGYTKIEADSADLRININLIIEEKKETRAYTDHYGGYYRAWGYSTTTYYDYDYKEGTLVIDMFDHKNKSLIWQGIAKGMIEEYESDRKKEVIDKVMSKIFKQWPVNVINVEAK